MSVLSSRIMKGSTSRLALLALAGSYAPAAAFGVTGGAAPYKDFWCVSGLNELLPINQTSSASACLEECKAAYPGVAKYGELLMNGECWCQDSCECIAEDDGALGAGPEGDVMTDVPPNCCDVHREHVVRKCYDDTASRSVYGAPWAMAYGCKAETTAAFDAMRFSPLDELDCIGTYEEPQWQYSCKETCIYLGDPANEVNNPRSTSEGAIARYGGPNASEGHLLDFVDVDVNVGDLLYGRARCRPRDAGVVQQYFTSKEDCETGTNAVSVRLYTPYPYRRENWLCGRNRDAGRRSLKAATKPSNFANEA